MSGQGKEEALENGLLSEAHSYTSDCSHAEPSKLGSSKVGLEEDVVDAGDVTESPSLLRSWINGVAVDSLPLRSFRSLAG